MMMYEYAGFDHEKIFDNGESVKLNMSDYSLVVGEYIKRHKNGYHLISIKGRGCALIHEKGFDKIN